MKQLRISLIAPSGAGKSTVARLMKDAFERAGRTVCILKLAAPLYQLQRDIYRECGVDRESCQQDQHLLELIATEMRRITPYSLALNFGRRLANTNTDVVLNDDLRDDGIDWPWLRQNGFTIIRVVAHADLRDVRLQSRGDLTIVKNSLLDAQVANISEDYTIANEGTPEELESSVNTLLDILVRSEQCTVES